MWNIGILLVPRNVVMDLNWYEQNKTKAVDFCDHLQETIDNLYHLIDNLES